MINDKLYIPNPTRYRQENKAIPRYGKVFQSTRTRWMLPNSLLNAPRSFVRWGLNFEILFCRRYEGKGSWISQEKRDLHSGVLHSRLYHNPKA